jgi:non-specific serine/threonine protein kinase
MSLPSARPAADESRVTAARTATPAGYRFGPFELHPSRRQLLRAGRALALGQRAFDVLLALVERAGHLVPKNDLLDLAWPGLVVEENNLQVQVSTLRKLLGPAAIATVAGRGYRFTPDVAPTHAAPPPSALRHNLPRPLTSFIGRDDDLGDHAALLAQTRLLTLTGIGGSGKTRLALALAERLLPAFPDGVWYVDLAPLTDGARVTLTVASVLEIPQQVDRSRVETLCRYLAGRRVLLVLDNCEHVAAGCADLAQALLEATTAVRVLAASRERLDMPGEWAVAVRPLRLPEAGAERDPAALAANEAVRLFVERAQMAANRFTLDAASAAAVAEVCRRLDGIPLAIELAAARVSVLSAAEIRDRLNDRFRLLTNGHGTTLARSQTLLEVIRWSYDHLAPDERQVLRLLSVFAGDWTLAGAAAIAGTPDDHYDVLDALARLVERSLVVVQRHADGRSRYAMLETVCQYARERLDESGEGDAARTRHLAYCLSLAESGNLREPGPPHAARLALLKAELENLLRALAWCDHADDGAQTGLRLAEAMLGFWFHAGHMHLGHQQMLRALARPAAAARNRDRARALAGAATLGACIGHFADAKAHAQEALAIAADLDDRRIGVDAAMTLAYLAGEDGDSVTALRYLEPALTRARATQDPALVAKLLNAIGEAHRVAGDMAAAQPVYEEALALARELKHAGMIASFGDNLARTYIPNGRPECAQRLLVEALTLALDSGSKWVALCALDVTSALAGMAVQWTFAARMRGAAEARVRTMRYRRDRADEAFLAPWTAHIVTALGDAAYRSAFDAGFALSHDEAGAEALAWLEANPRPAVERGVGVTS